MVQNVEKRTMFYVSIKYYPNGTNSSALERLTGACHPLHCLLSRFCSHVQAIRCLQLPRTVTDSLLISMRSATSLDVPRQARAIRFLHKFLYP